MTENGSIMIKNPNPSSTELTGEAESVPCIVQNDKQVFGVPEDLIDSRIEPISTDQDSSTTVNLTSEQKIVNNIYSLRNKFLIIGLTGRTGSGCSTVANILSCDKFSTYHSNYREFRNAPIDNQARKDRIVYNYLKANWSAFTVISASNIIYLLAFQLPFEDFINSINDTKPLHSGKTLQSLDESHKLIHELLNPIQEKYKEWNTEYTEILNNIIDNNALYQLEQDQLTRYCDLIFNLLPKRRAEIEGLLGEALLGGNVTRILQGWGNNIREYGAISKTDLPHKSPDTLAQTINRIIKLIKRKNKSEDRPTHIVIDALRSPFEILFFRERYAAFYCMSVNTPEIVRRDKLINKRKLSRQEVDEIDDNESAAKAKELNPSFTRLNIDKCIELSDILISHDGTPVDRNRNLVNQIFTYLALMFHPGLVSPTPEERLMQVAFTAKLNSGCLSRQVGAAVTDEHYSVKSIGWNSVPEGHVPCTLRRLEDILANEDEEAFSSYELHNPEFRDHINKLNLGYKTDKKLITNLKGLHLTYCFKDIYGVINPKQKYNQVHNRSLHAEENAFLQISKYGGQGLQNGKLFTTASCCEACARKAYHLGIREIYYIDIYPGISEQHIFLSGMVEKRPKLILFSGAVGRAYISLYSPFLALKDEIEAITGVDAKNPMILTPKIQDIKSIHGIDYHNS